jgi:hypothetical protein
MDSFFEQPDSQLAVCLSGRRFDTTALQSDPGQKSKGSTVSTRKTGEVEWAGKCTA